jgi:hypothetical protein
MTASTTLPNAAAPKRSVILPTAWSNHETRQKPNAKGRENSGQGLRINFSCDVMDRTRRLGFDFVHRVLSAMTCLVATMMARYRLREAGEILSQLRHLAAQCLNVMIKYGTHCSPLSRVDPSLGDCPKPALTEIKGCREYALTPLFLADWARSRRDR